MDGTVTMLRTWKRRLVLTSALSALVFFVFFANGKSTKSEYCKPKIAREDFVPSNIHLSFLNNDFKGDDQTLHKYIKASIIGHAHRGYNLYQPGAPTYSQAEQDRIVDAVLHARRQGFYVECGAAEGEIFSNTLFFERYRSWDGLLIEANPNLFKKILAKGRQAYSINACLSLSNKTKSMEFYPAGLLGGLSEGFTDSHKKAIGFTSKNSDIKSVQCYPLGQIMAAMGRTHIDYFSLDVEGPEVAILKTIPFDGLRIDVISIEYTIWDGKATDYAASKSKLKDIRELMESTELYNEHLITRITNQNTGDLEADGLDVIFTRKDLTVEIKR